MASTKKLVSKLVAGAPAAPSAPPAPGLRNVNGQTPTTMRAGAGSQSGAAASAIGLSGGYSPEFGFKNPPGGRPKPTYGWKKTYSSGGISPPASPPSSYTPPIEAVAQPAAKPGRDPASMISDPIYWQSRMALGQQYLGESSAALVDQTLADSAYLDESTRQKKDYDRGRRNIAESLLGRGSSIYGGMHQRDRTEGFTDFVQNTGKLDADYKTSNEGRGQERADIEARLGLETGSDYIKAANEWEERENARLIEQTATADPDYGMGKNEQRKNLVRQIKQMRKRHDKSDDPKQRKKIRAKIGARRKRLRELNNKDT